MPTVPRYSQQTVNPDAIRPAYSNTNFTDEMFGGGRVAQKLSEGLQAGENLLEEYNRVKATEAVTKAEDEIQRLMYDPENGALNKRGVNAFEAAKKAREEMVKVQSQVGKDLNFMARAKFDQVFQSRFQDYDKKLMAHEAQEQEEVDKQVTFSFIESEQNIAVRDFNDVERVQRSLVNQADQLERYGKRMGLPTEAVKNAILEAHSKTHTGIVERLLNEGQDLKAKAWFDQNRAAFAEKDALKVAKDLEEGMLRGEGQRRSDKIMLEAGDSLGQALARAREIEEPRLRDEVESRLKANYAVKEKVKNDQIERMHKTATDIIEQTASIDKIPPAIWRQFSLSERRQLKEYAMARATGRDTPTDLTTWYDLKTLAANPETRPQFLEENLLRYRGRLGAKEFKELANLQMKLRNGDEGAGRTLDGYRSDAMIVNDALAAMDIRSDTKAPQKEKERASRFRKMVDEELISFQLQNGRKANNNELQAIVDRLRIKGRTERGWIWDTEKFLFEVEPNEQFEIDVSEIPPQERIKIEEALRANNMPVTDTEVLNLFIRRQRGVKSAAR